MCGFWLVGSFGELDLRSNFFLFLGTDLGNMGGNFTCVASFGEAFYYVVLNYLCNFCGEYCDGDFKYLFSEV